MDKNQRLELLQKIDDSEDQNLCHLIAEIHTCNKSEPDPILVKWQKVNLAYSVSSYYIGWFALCRSNLNKALEPIENISKDSFNITTVNTEAGEISDEALVKAIEFICQKGSCR